MNVYWFVSGKRVPHYIKPHIHRNLYPWDDDQGIVIVLYYYIEPFSDVIIAHV